MSIKCSACRIALPVSPATLRSATFHTSTPPPSGFKHATAAAATAFKIPGLHFLRRQNPAGHRRAGWLSPGQPAPHRGRAKHPAPCLHAAASRSAPAPAPEFLLPLPLPSRYATPDTGRGRNTRRRRRRGSSSQLRRGKLAGVRILALRDIRMRMAGSRKHGYLRRRRRVRQGPAHPLPAAGAGAVASSPLGNPAAAAMRTQHTCRCNARRRPAVPTGRQLRRDILRLRLGAGAGAGAGAVRRRRMRRPASGKSARYPNQRAARLPLSAPPVSNASSQFACWGVNLPFSVFNSATSCPCWGCSISRSGNPATLRRES